MVLADATGSPGPRRYLEGEEVEVGEVTGRGQPRRTYAIGPAGEDCQEYTNRVLYQCRVSCGLLYPRREPSNPGRPGYRQSPL